MRSSRILLALSLMFLALAAAPAQAVENDETHWVGHDRAGKVMSPPTGKIGR